MAISLIKPKHLQPGDTVMTVSMSWGGAGAIPHRYNQGVKQLAAAFDLNVVAATNSNRSEAFIYENPQARAEDLMQAFSDPDVKGSISNIGGEDSIRTLPFIDLDIIKNNPKVFVGFSDTTIQHLANLRAGMVSFYGPSILAGFAENGGMFSYLQQSFRAICFETNTPGIIKPNTKGWTNQRLAWEDESLANVKRKLEPTVPWRYLQEEGVVQGHLIGGCIEVLEFIKGTSWFPDNKILAGAILFLETSEEKMHPDSFRWMLRNYAALGVFKLIKGIILGRPYENVYAKEYEANLIKVVREEEGCTIPIITQMDFGHSEPMMTLPIGVMAEINSSEKTFSVLESGVC